MDKDFFPKEGRGDMRKACASIEFSLVDYIMIALRETQKTKVCACTSAEVVGLNPEALALNPKQFTLNPKS